MATYTNLTDVNISSSLETPAVVTTVSNVTTANIGTATISTAALTTTNITGKANIVGAVTGVKSSVAYTWTNTNANFAELANVVAQVVSVLRGLT